MLTGRVESRQAQGGRDVQALSRIGQKIEQFRVTKILAFRGLAQRDRRGRGRRHRLARRHAEGHRGRHAVPWRSRSRSTPSRSTRPPSRSPSASTTARSRAATARRCSPRDPRTADERGRDERRHQGRRHARRRGLRGLGTRRIADGRADREHAPRRLRAVDLAPQVILREEDGQTMEPIEEVTIDVDDDYSGAVIEKITGPRRANWSR
jgi:GTP-binding protein